jgi:hypothetical protein
MSGFSKEVCDVLKENLPIYQRKGPGGTYPYVKGEDVIRQLNKAFGHAWSSEVVSQSADAAKDQVLMLVALRVATEAGHVVTHHGFGGAHIARNSSTGLPVDIGNTYKSAYTSALKKAAEQFGIGLGGEDPSDEVAPNKPAAAQSPRSFSGPSNQPPRPASRPPIQPPSKAAFTPPTPKTAVPVPAKPVIAGTAPNNDKITDIQARAITQISMAKGYKVEELIQKATNKETSLDKLTNNEAVAVIRFANSVSQKGA